MAYRADIEIAVKGAQELKRLQNEINSTSKLVKSLNDYIENFSGTGIVRSINTLRSAVASAATEFNKVALGTEEAVIAARKYVTATNELNAELKERAALLKTINEEERKNRLARAGIRETTQYGGPIGPGPASPVGALVGQKSPVEERIKRIIAGRKDQLELEQALLRLEQKSAEALNQELLARGRIAQLSAQGVNAAKFAAGQPGGPLMLPAFQERGLQVLNNSVRLNESSLRIEQALNTERARGVRFLEKQSAEEARQVQLGLLGQRTNRLPGQTGLAGGSFPVEGPMPLSQFGVSGRTTARNNLAAGMRGRLPGAISGGVIGAAFPLLFGQGGGAAAGGGIGGLLGGLMGPGGSFAGSLAGTLIGGIAESGNKVKALAEDMGLAKSETEQLAAAFRAAGADAEKFGDAVQYIRGIGFTDPEQVEAIKLVSKLTEDYGGKIDKVTSAYANFAARGKVGISDINKFTAQNIPVLDELEKKFGVNRDAVLKLAKDGKISAQQLSDALIAVANKSKEAADKTNNPWQSAWQKIVGGTQITVNAVGVIFGRLLSPIVSVASSIATAFGDAFDFIVRDAVQTAAEIAGALASAANNMQYLTKLKLFGDIKGGAKATQKDLLDLLKTPPKATPVGPIQIPGQLPATGGGTDKAAKDAAREAARVLEALRDQQLITIEIQRQSEYSKKIFAAEMAKDPILVRQLEGAQQLAELGVETAKRLEDEKNTSVQLAIAKSQQAKQALIRQKTEQDIAKIEQQRKENAQNTISGLQQELDIKNATTEAERNRLRIMYEMAALRQGRQFNEGELAQIEALKKQIAAPETAGEIIQKRIGALQDEIAKLTNLGTIAVSVADSIGAAFGQAFQGIISGTMTTQEALASFFQSIGDAFIQMATEIIAKQITMIILQTILKALGGGGANAMPFAGGPATGGTTNVGAYAAGAPTFFSPMANGGSVKAATPYLVGERGPELFVPGTNGGIMSNSDLRSSMGAAPGSAAGAPVFNMSFETSTINGVEYVSRDQLEAAMAQTRRQAARDGANRGMTMTLDKLQQSPSTRKRVGF